MPPICQPIDVNCITLNRFLISQQILHHGTGQFSQLMISIQTACKSISSAVRRAGMTGLYGLQGSRNTSGDNQQMLDVLANDLFINTIIDSHSVCLLISEENKDAIHVELSKRGKYIIAFDPLDGSSNIDCLGAIGSIFAIYEGPADPDSPDIVKDFLKQTGRSIIASGYTLYGSATMMVLAIRGCGVHGFTLDPSIGEFLLTEKDMKIGKKGKIYSVNEGYESQFETYVKEYIKSLKYPQSGSAYTARYIGSMVADVHRTLRYGGIFMYPENASAPRGKLRILYEAFPIAYIMEAAGGRAVDSERELLDNVSGTLHSPIPIFLGTSSDIENLISFKKKFK